MHENAPVVFQTRWTMSYLRGPLSRPQIASLMAPLKAALPAPAPRCRGRAAVPAGAAAAAAAAVAASAAATPPAAPSGVQPAYLPLRGAAPAGASLAYVPMLLGGAHVRLLDAKSQVDEAIDNARLAAFADGPVAIDWAGAADLSLALADLESAPREGAAFHELPTAARDAKGYKRWAKDYGDWLYQTQTVTLWRSPSQKLVSRSGESEADFRARLAQGAREGRDAQSEKLRAKYDTKVAQLQAKLHTAQQAVDREENQQRGAGLQTAVSVAGSILGGFLGRKAVTAGSLTTAARGAGRVAQQHDDVKRAEENVKLIEASSPSSRRSSPRTPPASGRGRRHRGARLRADPAQEGRHRRHDRHAGVRAALAGRGRAADARVLSYAGSISTRLSLNVGASRSVVSRWGVVACGLRPPA